MASHSNKNKKNKKRKLKDLTIKQLLCEQPFYISYIKKPNSSNLSIEELLGEHPFYKKTMKKPKRKRKKINLEFLQVLLFYDDVGIFKRKRAHKKCLASYHVKYIAKNSLSDSLFSSKEKNKKVI